MKKISIRYLGLLTAFIIYYFFLSKLSIKGLLYPFLLVIVIFIGGRFKLFFFTKKKYIKSEKSWSGALLAISVYLFMIGIIMKDWRLIYNLTIFTGIVYTFFKLGCYQFGCCQSQYISLNLPIFESGLNIFTLCTIIIVFNNYVISIIIYFGFHLILRIVSKSLRNHKIWSYYGEIGCLFFLCQLYFYCIN